MNLHRIERIQKAIQNEISSLLLFETDEPDLQRVTITHVILTKDLRLAKVYFDGLEGRAKKKLLLAAFSRVKGFLRGQLARKLNLRVMPEIQFFYDEMQDEISRIDTLFSKL